MLNFILKILQSAKIKPDRYFFTQNDSVIYNYVFLCYLDCFQIFKNHKNQRSQIVLNFILKILQSAKYQTGSIFFQLKISQLYIIMYFYVI